MSDTEERLIEDVLLLACTRPAMILGAPMEAMGINIILTAIAFLAGRSLGPSLDRAGPSAVFQAICKSDHNAFRVLWLWLDTRGRARNVALWGGSSATPLPLHRRMPSRARR